MAVASLVDENDVALLSASGAILSKLINEFKSRWRTNNSALLKFADYARTLRDLAAVDANAEQARTRVTRHAGPPLTLVSRSLSRQICEMGGLDLVLDLLSHQVRICACRALLQIRS